MSVRYHLEAAWRASLLEPQDEATAHIIWSIGRYLGPDTMARLTNWAMQDRNPETVVQRLEEVAESGRPLRVEVYAKQREKVHLNGDPLRVASTEHVTEYRWRVRHSNGGIMASGEGYVDKRDRDHAVALLHPDLDVVEVEG